MEHREVRLSEKTVYSQDKRVSYVKMLLPDGWKIDIKTDRNRYCGYTYPYMFRITVTSPDKTAAIYYQSPCNYLDNHLNPHNDYQLDDYGNLHHRFVKLEDYLDMMVNQYLKGYDPRFVQQVEDPNIINRQNKRKNNAIKKADSNGEILNWHYFNELCRIYSYRNIKTDRIRCYSAIIEASDTTKWSYVPDKGNYLNDPVMKQAMMMAFPNAQYDGRSNRYIYTSASDTSWNVRKILSMDCIEKDFEYVYNRIFKHIVNHGVTICDDIWNDFDRVKKENETRYAQIRAEKKQRAQMERQAKQQAKQRSKETYDYVRQTQKEIHDIQKSAYENSRNTQNKVSEMWSDVNRGNTRFVDKYGDEHVIHTYNDYAYKSGDSYVTSDSPLDHSYEWEELKKKKY